MREYTGSTVRNGELRFVSVSGVKLFDVNTKGGCARRWAYEKVFHFKADKDQNKEAKDAGTALDKEVKHYLATGDKSLSSLALRGLHILEEPGPDLGLDIAINTVEHWYNGQRIASLPEGQHDHYPKGTEHVIKSALTAAGVPFVGELDGAHARGHWRDEDGEYHDDPPGTVEVFDIKRKGNTKDRNGNSILMLPSDLIRDIQMAGYGEWMYRVRPETTHVRVSLCVFPEKDGSKIGTPRKITKLHVLEDYHRTWARVESIVREMRDVARVTDINHVPGAHSIDTCNAYSGCPHREYCTAYRSNSLDKVYGKIGEDHANNAPGWGVPQPQLQETAPMGLMANNPQIMQQTVQQQPQPDMRAALAAEEAQQRAAVAQQQAQMPQPLNIAALGSVCTRLGTFGYGFPALAGNAALAFAVLNGQQASPGATYAGVFAPPGARRSLHTIQCTETQHLEQLLAELEAERAREAAPPVQATQPVLTPQAPTGGILPPDAPQSIPALAMQQPSAPSGIAPWSANAPDGQALLKTPFDAGSAVAQSGPIITTQPGYNAVAQIPPAQTAPDPMQTPPAAAPARRGRRPKAETPPAAQAPAPAPSAFDRDLGVSPATQIPMIADSAAAIQGSTVSTVILINARSSKNDTKSLNEYVDYINAQLSARYCVGPDGRPTIQDVRCAPKDSGLAYGGWPGAVREAVKADPPPPGRYHLDTFMDALNEAVADALRVVADRNGWEYIRGVRG